MVHNGIQPPVLKDPAHALDMSPSVGSSEPRDLSQVLRPAASAQIPAELGVDVLVEAARSSLACRCWWNWRRTPWVAAAVGPPGPRWWRGELSPL